MSICLFVFKCIIVSNQAAAVYVSHYFFLYVYLSLSLSFLPCYSIFLSLFSNLFQVLKLTL